MFHKLCSSKVSIPLFFIVLTPNLLYNQFHLCILHFFTALLLIFIENPWLEDQPVSGEGGWMAETEQCDSGQSGRVLQARRGWQETGVWIGRGRWLNHAIMYKWCTVYGTMWEGGLNSVTVDKADGYLGHASNSMMVWCNRQDKT